MPLSEREAFDAMFRFLTAYWERTGRPDDVGALLGDLNPDLFSDGAPADAAAWSDWLEAVEAVRSSEA
jgi:hypothetical protein